MEEASGGEKWTPHDPKEKSKYTGAAPQVVDASRKVAGLSGWASVATKAPGSYQVQASAGARDGGEEWRAPSRPSSMGMRPDTDSVELFPTLGGGGGGGGGGKVRQQVGAVYIERSSFVSAW
jgi:hypothetical protein